jgi:hypothetical protein
MQKNNEEKPVDFIPNNDILGQSNTKAYFPEGLASEQEKHNKKPDVNAIQKPSKKIYNGNAVWLGTFIGGPLVAGYLIAENYKVFNEPGKAKKAWVYAILATIAIFGGLFLLPDSTKIPNTIIPLFYTAITWSIVQYYQATQINAHIDAGGLIYKRSRAFVVGLIGAVIIAVPFIGLLYLTDPALSATTKTYGNIHNEILFNSTTISENEINQIADGLTKQSFFDETQRKSIFVKKDKEKYILMICLIDSSWEKTEVVGYFNQLRWDMQTLFPNNKITIELCSDLRTVKKQLN